MRSSQAASILGAIASAAAASRYCPPLGPVLPAPRTPSSNAVVAQAVQAFGETFGALTESLNSSAMSIGIQSIHEDSPLLQLFWTPPGISDRGVRQVDANTIYRIGSVSKLFPALAALQLAGATPDDAVTKYLPQLRELKRQQPENNEITTVDWDSVTLGSLASHLAGIGSDYAFDLTTLLGSAGVLLGLPNITDTSILPGCAGLLGLPPCNATDFYEDFGRRPPVYAPYTTPVYSNIGYSILALVVEAASNTTFADFVQQNILDVAGMSRTSLTVPSADEGFIATGEIWWDADLGVEMPAGGMFSTIPDLLAFGKSILTHRLLTPTQTRKWLKPMAFTSSMGTAVGAAWEILRSETVTNDSRVVEFYTKSGDLGLYHSQFVLVPDYDLVVVVLTAGPESSSGFSQLAMSRTIQGLLPAIEQAGKDEAAGSFAGTYADAASNSTVKLVLGDGPGLVVAEWVVRGVDIFQNYFAYGTSTAPSPVPPVSARLYPTNLKAGNQTAWRAVFEVGTDEERASDLDNSLFWPEAGCNTWARQDRMVWAYKALDEFIFTTEDCPVKGVAESVVLTGFQVSLARNDG